MALNIDAKFEENWVLLSKMTRRIWQIFTGWKIAIFILESKMAELKEPGQPDAVWKLCFILKINE